MTRNTSGLSRRLPILLVVAVAAFLLLVANRVDARQPAPPTTVHVVEPGETLWSIAAEVTGPDQDVRPTVHVLRELNRLTGSVIVPGERLLIPAG